MPVVEVTPTLAEVIKAERKKRNIRGDNLSKELGKTNTFISQIETGKIKEIDSKLFYEIFKHIIDIDNYNNFMNNLTKDTNEFKMKYSIEEINQEKWFLSFQERYCLIPIPDSIIDFIKLKLVTLNISPEELIIHINKNETLENKDDYNDNEYVVNMNEDGLQGASIKFNLKKNLLRDIIDKKETSICYIFMLGIIFNIHILEGKNKYDANALARKLLYDNDFITPETREIQAYKKKEKLNIPEFDISDLYENEFYKEFASLNKEINNYYKSFRDLDIQFANQILKQHIKNLDCNLQFTMALLGLPLSKIETNKQKEFFDNLKDLISKYIKHKAE